MKVGGPGLKIIIENRYTPKYAEQMIEFLSGVINEDKEIGITRKLDSLCLYEDECPHIIDCQRGKEKLRREEDDKRAIEYFRLKLNINIEIGRPYKLHDFLTFLPLEGNRLMFISSSRRQG